MTDRNALEAARDALPPLPEPAYWLSTDSKRGRRIAWNPVAFFQQKPAGKFMGVFTGDQFREAVTAATRAAEPIFARCMFDGQCCEDTAKCSANGCQGSAPIPVTAALSSPPVLPAEPVFNPDIHNETTFPAGVPALDDARDAKAERRQRDLGAAIEEAASQLPRGVQITVTVERDAGWVTVNDYEGNDADAPECDGDLAASIRAVIRSVMQQEPRS